MKILEYIVKILIYTGELILSILIVLTLNIFIDLDNISLILVILIYMLLPSEKTVLGWMEFLNDI